MRNTRNHTVRISRTAVIAVLALCISTGLGAEDISIHGLMVQRKRHSGKQTDSGYHSGRLGRNDANHHQPLSDS